MSTEIHVLANAPCPMQRSQPYQRHERISWFPCVFLSQPTVSDESYFLEKLEENHYNTYRPQKHQERNWYVALKKNGKPKLGPRTHIGQKAVFFLPRQLDGSGE